VAALARVFAIAALVLCLLGLLIACVTRVRDQLRICFCHAFQAKLQQADTGRCMVYFGSLMGSMNPIPDG
jgi:hypothetical protein